MKINLKMPKTKTPGKVYVWLNVALVLLAIIAFFAGGTIGIIVLFVLLALGTPLYCKTVPGYHAVIILNHLTGAQRTLFQGLNLILPWETKVKVIDLRVEMHEARQETYPSQDALMQARYVYTIRPDFTGDYAGENIILYATYEPNAIKLSGQAMFSMLISDYFGKNDGEDLRDKSKINKAVFESDPGAQEVKDFEKGHGVKVGVRLEDSDYDPKTQKYRDTISAAKSFKEAIDELMKGDKSMNIESATRIVKLMNLENTSEVMYDIDLDTKGLENLRDVTLFGAGGLNKGTGGTTKKH